jgi:hypothetical protein
MESSKPMWATEQDPVSKTKHKQKAMGRAS